MGLRGYLLLFIFASQKGYGVMGLSPYFYFAFAKGLWGYELLIFFICFCHKTAGFRVINREGFSIKDRVFRLYPKSKSEYTNIRIIRVIKIIRVIN